MKIHLAFTAIILAAAAVLGWLNNRHLASAREAQTKLAAEAATLLRAKTTAFVLVSSPRAEAIDEAAHLADALRDGGFPLRAMVINLVNPTPAEIDLADEPTELPPGPLADQFALYRDVSALAADEAVEMDRLRDLAGEVALVEVPLIDDIHDLSGLTELGTHLLLNARIDLT